MGEQAEPIHVRVEHLLKFCGLDEDQESLIPKLWYRLGEKSIEAMDKQREIRVSWKTKRRMKKSGRQ